MQKGRSKGHQATKAFSLIILVIFSFGFSSNVISEIQTALMKEDYAQVERLASRLLDSNPTDNLKNEANYYLALSHLRLGKYIEAREIFLSIQQRDKHSNIQDKITIGLFDSYYLNGDYKQALRVIQKLLKASPNSEFSSLVYLKAARVNLKLSRWKKARNYLRKTFNEFPGSLEAFTARQLIEEKQFFAVQVGSFIERQRAEQLVYDLKQKNEYAYIVETRDRDNREFYRVRVGQLASLQQALSLKSRLSKEGYPTQIYP